MIQRITQLNKNIAIYARVSSTRQENEGTIETQLSAIRSFAKDNDLTIVQEYLDNGWSGDIIVRPELDKLRIDAKGKKWNSVLIYDPDRLARRYSYQELIIDELKEAGKSVLFVTTPAPNNSIEKILYGVQGLFAEYERAKITERFRLGKLRKATEGHIQVSEAPYGYTYILKKGKKGDKDFEEGHYEINPIEANILRQIYTWIGEEGNTIRKVIKLLHDNNMPPRRSKKGVWANSTLCGVLRNKTYIGEAHFGVSLAVVPKNPKNNEVYKKVRKSSKVRKPESEWITIKTPAIIDKDLFDKVQIQLKQNAHYASRNAKFDYLLSGKIWCTCGSKRSAETLRRGYGLCYRCSSRFKHYPLKSPCTEKTIRAEETDQVVWESVAALMSSPELLKQQILRFKAKKEAIQEIDQTEILNKEIAKLEEQKKRYSKAYGEGILSLEQLKEFVFTIDANMHKLKQRVGKSAISRFEDSNLLTSKDIRAFSQKVIKQLCNLDFITKKEIIRNVVEKVVGNKERLIISGYIPVNHALLSSNQRYSTNTIQTENPLPFIVKSNDSAVIPFQIEVDVKPKLRIDKAA